MRLDVRARSEQPLFLAAPQRDANGTARREPDRLDDPRRLHHRRAAGRVVGCARRRVDRVEVRAQDHHFAGEIGSRDLRDGVEPLAVVVKLHAEIQLHLDRHVVLEQTNHAVVVLDGQRDLRHAGGRVAAIRRARKHRAAVGVLLLPRQLAASRGHVAVAPAIEDGDDPFVLVELLQLLLERLRRRIVGIAAAASSSAASAAARAAPALSRHRRRLGLARHRLVHLQDERAFEHAHGTRGLRQQDSAFELSAIFREVRFALDRDSDHVRGHGAAGADAPRFGEADERLHFGLDEVRAEPHERPSFAEVPLFAVHVREAPLGEALHRPVAGVTNLRRAGQPRPVPIGEPEQVIHHLRSVQSLVADLPDSRVIELLGLRRRRRNRDDKEQEDRRPAQHGRIVS